MIAIKSASVAKNHIAYMWCLGIENLGSKPLA